MDKVIKLASGNELDMSSQAFAVGSGMYKVICRELKNVDIKDGIDFRTFFDKKSVPKGEEINFIKDIFFSISSSEEFEALLFKCFEKCNWNKRKVVPALFDESDEAKADYIEMAWEVSKLNLAPFFKSLLSLFAR